ncbi:MAG: endonuclease MutS2, partial [Lachnospiraceae bacterium]
MIALLTEQASSPNGKRLCQQLVPHTDLETIVTAQLQTEAAFTRIVKKGRLSFSGCYAIEDSMKRLEIGASLSCNELLRICKLLETTARVKSYGRHETVDELADCLDVYFEELEPLNPVVTEIRHCILDEDEISDDASSNLKRIRRNIQILNDKVHSTLTNLVNGSLRTYLQDPIITMRGDRYCIPVKSEYRGQVQGMIHD